MMRVVRGSASIWSNHVVMLVKKPSMFSMRALASFGVTRSSFMPHAYDPEVHKPMALSSSDHARLDSDASFIAGYARRARKSLSPVNR